MSKTLSIIIPVYNEQDTLHLILDAVGRVELIDDMKKEVILVNDCSTDNSRERIDQYKSGHPDFPMKVYDHEKKQGKRGRTAYGN